VPDQLSAKEHKSYARLHALGSKAEVGKSSIKEGGMTMATEETKGQERALERRRGGAVMNPLKDMERALERLFPRGWPRPWRGEWPS
jgi:hypothetical protein